ncbi:hypothetical protein DESPIGER_2179 [Desulfovibrio piger]|uniref:Uncharacterized protein n=1 Tax=Desulfovibrio piger TaxID=901 RepID=A0A1K1LH17_9BACT|nr:hypothetical protein DESPIGER_2179 [Desulfovibrio piger]
MVLQRVFLAGLQGGLLRACCAALVEWAPARYKAVRFCD